MARFRWAGPIPWRVWAATTLFVGVLLGWSVLSPLGRPPDETAHVDVVLHLASGGSYPEFDEHHPSTGVLRTALLHTPGFGGTWLTSDGAPPKRGRPTFSEAGGAEPTASINQIPQHPPAYYQGMAVLLRAHRWVTPGDDAAIDREWNLLRLFNIALLAPLPVLAWATARRLRAGVHAAETAAFLPLVLPQLTHIGASVNNDNLLVVLAAVVSFGVAGVLTGDERRSTAALIGMAAAIAVLTKAFGFLLLPWIVVAYGYQVFTRGPGGRRGASNLLLAIGPASLAGASWLTRNLIRHDELMPSSLDDEFARPRPGFTPDLVAYIREYGSGLGRSAWGSFGAHEARLGVPVVVLASAALAGFVLVGLRHRRTPPAEEGRRGESPIVGVLFLALAVGLALVLLIQDYDSYRHSGLHPFMQGRYLFAAVVPVIVVAAIGVARVFGRRGPVVVLVAATVIQGLGAREALLAWWGAPGSAIRESAAALVAWSTWPSPLVVGAALAAGATWATALILLLWEPTSAVPGESVRGERDLEFEGAMGEGVPGQHQ